MLLKEELGNYLKKVRNFKGLSLREVDKKTGISYTYLNMIENGKRNVKPILLRNLASLYNISYLDLYEKAGYLDLIKNKKNNKYIINKVNNSVINIPLLGTIKNGYDYLSKENWISTISVDKKLSEGRELFALKVHEDSMSPVIVKDDIVIISKQDDFETGDIVVAIINGDEATIKKGKKNHNNILLQPLNTSYEPLVFTKNEMRSIPVNIIGIVKQLKREF